MVLKVPAQGGHAQRQELRFRRQLFRHFLKRIDKKAKARSEASRQKMKWTLVVHFTL